MKRPLILYLDSSDYSRFGDVHRGTGTEESEQVFLAVSKFIRDGDVQVPFSGLHIMEAAARDLGSLDAATARLAVIGSLGQGNAFRGWTELPSIDLFHRHGTDGFAQNAKPVDRKVHNGRSDQGEWFPGLPSLFLEIGEMFATAYRNPIVAFSSDPDNAEYIAGLNRDQRRKLAKQAKRPVSPGVLRQMVDSEWPSKYAELRANLPLPIADSEIWRKYVIAPQPNLVNAYQSCRRGFADLSTLATYLVPGDDSINQRLTGWLRHSSSSIVNVAEQVNALRARWKNIKNDALRSQQKRRVLEDAKQFHNSWLAREHSDLLKEMPAVYDSYRLSGDAVFDMPNTPSFDTTSKLASISNRALVIRSYREIAVNPLGTERAPAKHSSDPGDILHAQYIPYCDIYRCDGFASTYLKKVADQSKTTLVSSLPQLTSVIEARLRQMRAT